MREQPLERGKIREMKRGARVWGAGDLTPGGRAGGKHDGGPAAALVAMLPFRSPGSGTLQPVAEWSAGKSSEWVCQGSVCFEEWADQNNPSWQFQGALCRGLRVPQIQQAT